MNGVLVAGRERGEERGRFAGAGNLLAAHLLHALREQLRGPLVEHEAIDEAQLNSEQEDNEPGQKILIAIKFHRQDSLGTRNESVRRGTSAVVHFAPTVTAPLVGNPMPQSLYRERTGSDCIRPGERPPIADFPMLAAADDRWFKLALTARAAIPTIPPRLCSGGNERSLPLIPEIRVGGAEISAANFAD